MKVSTQMWWGPDTLVQVLGLQKNQLTKKKQKIKIQCNFKIGSKGGLGAVWRTEIVCKPLKKYEHKKFLIEDLRQKSIYLEYCRETPTRDCLNIFKIFKNCFKCRKFLIFANTLFYALVVSNFLAANKFSITNETDGFPW